MKIGILGTGHVAGLLGAAWQHAGHQVTPGAPNGQPRVCPSRPLSTPRAVRTSSSTRSPGAAAVEAISAIDPRVFDHKTVIDVANALTATFRPAVLQAGVTEGGRTVRLRRGN